MQAVRRVVVQSVAEGGEGLGVMIPDPFMLGVQVVIMGALLFFMFGPPGGDDFGGAA